MSVTSKNIYTYQREKEQGKRGFPGPAGPVSGGVYPSAGIPISNGTSWGTSIANNSANWNTAYGWGDWHSDMALKAPIANPNFTGNVDIGTVDSLSPLNVGGNIFIPYDNKIWSRTSGSAGYNAGIVLFDGSGDMVLTNYFGSSGTAGKIKFRTSNVNNTPEDAAEITKEKNFISYGNIVGVKLQTANWSFEEDGSDLIIKRGSTVLARLSSTGAWNTKDEQESHDATP